MNNGQEYNEHPACKICSVKAGRLGSKKGKLTGRTFNLFRCPNCNFVFVGNPWLDYEEIYSESYYKGLGVDGSVDYVFELENPDETIRRYEWRGIVEVIRSCIPLERNTRWLDFGCGNGGLVRFGKERVNCSISGYETGWIRGEAIKHGISILNNCELELLSGTFDVITAIEVLEHLPDPLCELKRIRSLLKPGGLFFYTTGNAAAFRDRLLNWSYVLPEVHTSFFEPKTLAIALRAAGFRADFRGTMSGYQDIIRFKTLKSLGCRRVSLWEKCLPWRLCTDMLNWRLQVTAHPIGWAE